MRRVQQQGQAQPLQHHRTVPVKGFSNHDMMSSSNIFGLRAIRLLLYIVASASLIMVLFMAQRLESRYARLRDSTSTLESPWLVRSSFARRVSSLSVIPDLHQPDPLEISAKKEIQKEALKKIDQAKADKYNAQASSAKQVAMMNAEKAATSTERFDRLVNARFEDTIELKVSNNNNDEKLSNDKTKLNGPPRNNVSTVTKKTIVDTVTNGKEPALADANVLVVIISNRRDGIIPTLASIISTSSKPVDVVLIGDDKINDQVKNHFGNRINEFTSLTVREITDDLEAQGMKPIWTWPEWHSSMDPSWKNENTIHVGPWDNLPTHAHELNHLRFYLPYVSVFKSKSYFYFLDDDILVKKDLGVLAQKTMEELDSSNGLVCPCNIWMWNSECFHFEFQSKKDYILSMPSLYGDRDVCKTNGEAHCVPGNYWNFVESLMPKGGKSQHAWNFGFSLFALKNWRDLKLTEKYEAVMRENYRLHVFPETSLTFGLGVAYIAFAGNVECWNEDHAKIRDGFGFIEWDRYEATFGQNFFDDVDVVHFTGPDKPWVNESRIETRAIDPWLKMMEKENMPIPVQLPEHPTDNLFTLLSAERSGAQWVMSVLDGHPEICASGENDKPETGFPTDVLLPEGLPWYPYCSIKRGCTYEFAETNVLELVADMQDGTPTRCKLLHGKEANSDPLGQHLRRMCNFVEALNGNFEKSNIAKVWVDAFVHDDRSLTGCGCVRGVKAKGLKVMAEWIAPKGNPGEEFRPPSIILDDTRIHGSKVIRLKRRNIWARYKSMIMAKQTGMFHPTSAGEKQSQLASMKPVTIDISHMEWNMKHMEFIDQIGDEWAKKHASDVLWLEYEDCRANTADCFERVYNFIGVDSADIKGKRSNTYKSFFASFEGIDSSLDYIENRGEILELLGINGWDHYVSGEKYIPIQFLTYEEEPTIVETAEYMGINSTIYGQDKDAEGYGSKYSAVLPILKTMDENTLVVISNDRDGRVNFPIGNHEEVFKALYSFRRSFQNILQKKPGSVVLSTDDDCCASALSHINPGDLFREDGTRQNRACSSGEPGCQWAGDEKANKWQSFMKSMAEKRTGMITGQIFLDTSLLGGKAGDLVKFIEALALSDTEDDRAVITDFMHRFPDRVFLDYKEQLFGASSKSPDHPLNGACLKSEPSTAKDRRLVKKTSSNALFMYSPRSLGCTDAKKLSAPKYPLWDGDGIDLRPILEHIPRVANVKESIVLPPFYGREPDYRQGPEVPYVVSEEGILSSRLIRNRTENSTLFWRLKPTETILQVAHDVLMREDLGSPRWRSLKKTVRSGGFPYWAWYGDYKTCNYHNYDDDSIPLFTTCAVSNCKHTFPTPNYMTILDAQTTEENWRGVFSEYAALYPWESKKRQVVWRGALSEAEWRDALTSVRWRFAKLVHELQSPLYDAGLTSIPPWLTDKINFNLTEIGGFKKGIAPMTTFQKYMAILDMDGNSWSSRFGSLLCYNSAVIKVEPKYFEYFYADLKPWSHYIPVKNDLTDLHEKVQWALDPQNEAAVKNIIHTANQWCWQNLLPEQLATDMLDIWESYVRQLDRHDPNWRDVWNEERGELLADPQLDFVSIDKA